MSDVTVTTPFRCARCGMPLYNLEYRGKCYGCVTDELMASLMLVLLFFVVGSMLFWVVLVTGLSA